MDDPKSVLLVLSGFACVRCGRNIPVGQVKGSYKDPYCEECYQVVFGDNDAAYLEWLRETHGGFPA